MIKSEHYLTNTQGKFYRVPKTVATPEECATLCSKIEDCTVFSYKNKNRKCNLYKEAELQKRNAVWEGYTCGICPKSKDSLDFLGQTIRPKEDLPSRAPNLQCLKNNQTKLCHFPFLYQGKLQWDSIKDDSGQCKCSSVDQNIGNLMDHSSMDTLSDCGHCDSGKIDFY